MTENQPALSLLTEPRSIRALQRAVGGMLRPDEGNDIGQMLGQNEDVWAEVITTKHGRSARVTLLDPARYGFGDFSTIEIRNVQDAAPRFIGTPRTSYEDSLVQQADIVDPGYQAQIANAVAAIVVGAEAQSE